MSFFTARNEERKATTRRTGGFRARFGRRDPDRVAGGYKAALSNPNTTRAGRKRAKRELKAMGRGDEARVPLMTRIKRTFGIRSGARREKKPRRPRTTLRKRAH
ncbi:hypothetical protein ONZ51_g4009 [Trametes cubensis]|uniref:Uncharacterized protein n=1 Tax=Trametes cubensis TaxID=1111947 RepID=A0AAD7XF43_9APHY|nr:hypothetical protein ONZ51_g4009 [Trametes cubensis]